MATTSYVSGTVCVSQNEDDARQIAWATSVDWGRHRTLIAQLYQENPMAKVMQIMENEHGFKATSVNHTLSHCSVLADDH